MSTTRFSFGSYLLRLAAALLLVFATYNPSGYSWYHWFLGAPDRLDPLLLLSGVVLLIGWVIYLRATFRSLGVLGTFLAIAFFGALVWVLVGYDIVSLNNPTLLTYVVLLVIAAIMATGLSWSHIRRRITGQIDVDEVNED